MCRKVVDVVGKERDGDGRRTRRKVFLYEGFSVYIGRCWQHRKNTEVQPISIVYFASRGGLC